MPPAVATSTVTTKEELLHVPSALYLHCRDITGRLFGSCEAALFRRPRPRAINDFRRGARGPENRASRSKQGDLLVVDQCDARSVGEGPCHPARHLRSSARGCARPYSFRG